MKTIARILRWLGLHKLADRFDPHIGGPDGDPPPPP